MCYSCIIYLYSYCKFTTNVSGVGTSHVSHRGSKAHLLQKRCPHVLPYMTRAPTSLTLQFIHTGGRAADVIGGSIVNMNDVFNGVVCVTRSLQDTHFVLPNHTSVLSTHTSHITCPHGRMMYIGELASSSSPIYCLQTQHTGSPL